MSRDWIYYFGYGSLVNRDTRPPDEQSIRARLSGWGRVWGHRVQGEGQHSGSCSLTVAKSTGFIDGVVVGMPAADLPVLDQRERGYARLSLPLKEFDLDGSIDAEFISVYQSLPVNRGYATESSPILLSYVDCVLAGYEKQFGNAGLTAFMQSTDGWHGKIENDRHSPRYPRAIELSPETHKRFDQALYNTIHGNK